MKYLILVLLAGTCASAQPSFVTSGNCGTGGGGCTTGTMSVTSGQIVVISCISDSVGTNVITASDSQSTTLTQITGSPFHNTFIWNGIWTGTIGSTSASYTVTCGFTQTNNFGAGIAGVYSLNGGTLSSKTCSALSGNQTAPTTFTAPANTTVIANQLIIGLFAINASNPVFTPGGSFTSRRTSGSFTGGLSPWGYLEDRTVSSTGSFAASVSLTDGATVETGNSFTMTLVSPGLCPGDFSPSGPVIVGNP